LTDAFLFSVCDFSALFFEDLPPNLPPKGKQNTLATRFINQRKRKTNEHSSFW
jgi:hypothetical protein